MRLRLRTVACLAAAALAFSERVGAAGLSTVQVASGLSAPVYATAPTGDARVFIVESGGRIRILKDSAILEPPFLDIQGRVSTSCECGLLSAVFPPSYAQDGAFYVYYTAPSSAPGGITSHVSRFHAKAPFATSTTADASHEEPIFSLAQPYSNHNGGTLAVRGGFLYLGLGDGGSGGDPENRAQDDNSLFGKLLRFDLSQQNPAAEVWAKGLRNPFRFSFDRVTGDLYIGDVGQNKREEIDVTPAGAPQGLNYGWAVMEGSECYKPVPGAPPCHDPSLTLPVTELPHSVYETPPCGVAITGGSVYRGAAIPSLRGEYFFSDYCVGKVWSFRWDGAGGTVGPVVDRSSELVPDQGQLANLTAISEDGFGELYFVNLNDGSLHKLLPEPCAGALGLSALAMLAALCARPRDPAGSRGLCRENAL